MPGPEKHGPMHGVWEAARPLNGFAEDDEPENGAESARAGGAETESLFGGPPPPRRGPGRQPGQVWRRTRDLLAMLEHLDAHPLLALGKVIATTPEELAKRLGISVVEAYDRWQKCCEIVLPYCQPRLSAVEIKADVTDSSSLHLTAAEATSAAILAGEFTLEGEREDAPISSKEAN